MSHLVKLSLPDILNLPLLLPTFQRNGKGNVFTDVSLSIHRGGGGVPPSSPPITLPSTGQMSFLWRGYPSVWSHVPSGEYSHQVQIGVSPSGPDRRGYPHQVTGGMPISSQGDTPIRSWWGCPRSGMDGCTPLVRTGLWYPASSPPPGRNSTGVVGTQWAACLLRSRRRTLLLP